MSPVEDGTLVLRAQSGDREAFAELASRHERALFGVARAYFASEADVEDAVQEAFMKALRALGQLRDEQRFAPWLTKVTVNTCLGMLRSGRDRVSLDQFSSSIQVSLRVGREVLTPATLAKRSEYTDLLKAAIGHLPPEQRVAVMLRYRQDMTFKQMGTYLGVPLTTVQTRVQSAKSSLKRALKALSAITDT